MTTKHSQDCEPAALELKFTKRNLELCKLTRRQLLVRSLAVGSSLMIGGGFIAGSNAAWALEVKALKPESMATLVQMARDVFPHDNFSDEIYAAAVKGHDEKAAEDPEYKNLMESGVALLNQMAQAMDKEDYLSVGWEADRNKILNWVSSGPFFKTIRGGLVVSLYNQEAVWEKLGYEGASFEQGGYLNRGFDDIDWL